MTVASLAKLSVPLPPGQSAQNQGLLMPKLAYRFRVTLINFGVTSPTTEITKQVISVTRPDVSFDEVVLDAYNSRVNLTGKPKWGDVTLVVRDDATGAVQQLCGEQIQKQFDFYEQSSAASGIDYKFTTLIEILDGGNGAYQPNVLESFELDGCLINKIKYADANYKESTPLQIDMTIRFDTAIQFNPANTPYGIGENVGRTVGTLSTG